MERRVGGLDLERGELQGKGSEGRGWGACQRTADVAAPRMELLM